jgi:hypothetical protein
MADDNRETLTEKWLRGLKNNPVIALLVIIFVTIVGIFEFSEAVSFLYRLVIPIGDNYESDLSKSIEKLKSDNIDIRAEAIHTLARVAEDSGKHRVNVLDVLSSFVRRQTPWRPGVVLDKIEKDVQLALTTIALIPKKDDKGNLHRVQMQNIDISEANLENANLEGAIFWGSNLRNVNLSRANLKGADLGGVDFTDASLEMADLEKALLWMSAYVEPKRPSIFDRTKLAGANLTGAHLEAAILTEAIDLTGDQLRQAIINENTKLPRGITVPTKIDTRPPGDR